jgi:hypothetical protein
MDQDFFNATMTVVIEDISVQRDLHRYKVKSLPCMVKKGVFKKDDKTLNNSKF